MTLIETTTLIYAHCTDFGKFYSLSKFLGTNLIQKRVLQSNIFILRCLMDYAIQTSFLQTFENLFVLLLCDGFSLVGSGDTF